MLLKFLRLKRKRKELARVTYDMNPEAGSKD